MQQPRTTDRAFQEEASHPSNTDSLQDGLNTSPSPNNPWRKSLNTRCHNALKGGGVSWNRDTLLPHAGREQRAQYHPVPCKAGSSMLNTVGYAKCARAPTGRTSLQRMPHTALKPIVDLACRCNLRQRGATGCPCTPVIMASAGGGGYMQPKLQTQESMPLPLAAAALSTARGCNPQVKPGWRL